MSLAAPQWAWPAVALAAVALGLVAWSYRHPAARVAARRGAAALKVVGVALLALCLAEPQVRRVRAQPGANRLLVLVDDSASMAVRDRGAEGTRGDTARALLADDAAWLLRAGADFDVRRHAFHARVRGLTSPEELTFESYESALATALTRLAAAGGGRPVAGIVVLTDGTATDAFRDDFAWASLPPVFPVLVGDRPERDLALSRVAVTQTVFEESPVTLTAELRAVGCAGEPVTVELQDEQGVVLERRVVDAVEGRSTELRFHAPPEASGVHFYRLAARLADGSAGAPEATTENNLRWAVVDRGAGPFRVLYASGRPSWEFKFLNRAVQEDPELELVGLLRIARRQPRFTFREGQDRRNQLWDGFDNRPEDSAEQLDEPVLLRLGTRDEFELREGFPRKAEDLFAYDALILDDLEVGFFDGDQLALIEEFVARRGGGFLALGGEHSFRGGEWARTPLADVLPVYLDAPSDGRPPGELTLALTREGWLEPWVRLRSTEDAERLRLSSMPAFQVQNRVGDVKPGGAVLVESRDVRGEVQSALVAQRYGRGRAAAWTVGDLWRWDLRRADPAQSDLGTAWRQLLRWLVADVPLRAELRLEADGRAVQAAAALRDEDFGAVVDARATVEVVPPDGHGFTLEGEPSDTDAGVYEALFLPREPGPYRARLVGTAADGSALGEDAAGWVAEPAAEELSRLEPDRALLEELARRTGGRLVAPEDLEAFAAGLVRADVPLTESELVALWHRWWVLLLALTCLCAEWAVRRLHGLP